MAEMQDNSVLTQLELLERTSSRLSVEDYARMMLLLMQDESLMHVRDVQKRTPDDIKTNALLISLADVAEHVNEKAFIKAHTQWKKIAFPPALNDLAVEVARRLRGFGLQHIRRVYNVISLDRFALLTGLECSLPDALAYALDAGLEHDGNSNFLTVPAALLLMPDQSMDDEDWVADLDGLSTISDTVWALGRQPNPTNDSLRKMHDY
ncbi:hypothetical protein BV898_16315 [Hypsibius exemplaris]|uniref:Uncharacterized protein n=1 Tax=Hypsibius exemplaris TaxID=2072580 RepID=A0A9X6NF27_HYPEX|nr:hypothetical protein BV898_16315 [Hypsibius exemplaris]